MRRLVFLLAPLVVLGSCSSSSSKSAPPSSTASSSGASSTTSSTGTSSTGTGAPARALRVLVTNDDGVAAPGIDALVQALRAVPNTTTTVVAPATNQSGTGSKHSTGALSVSKTTTASGYPATAVKGFPADTIVWAIDDHGVAQRPDVVLSGVNNGQNIGVFVDLSGTIGAARAAAQRGIPSLALSAGLGAHPAFTIGANQAVAWLAQHRAALLARPASSAPATVTNLNVPTCPSGTPRPLVVVPVAPKSVNAVATVDCVAPAPKPITDVDGFVHGYIVETDNLPLTG